MKLRTLFPVLAASLTMALTACAAEPKALYFTPGQPSDFGICGKPAPAGDATSEFVANGRRYRMLWVKGIMCEFSDKGAFLKSYAWGASPANATHVYVDRSGVLADDQSFGPVQSTSTDEQIGQAALIDAAGLALLIAAAGLVWFISASRRSGARRKSQGAGPVGDLAIIVEDNVFPNLNVVRALGAGAVLGVTNCFPVNVIDPRRSEAEMKALLGDTWYIFNADDLDHQFTSLLETGHAERFDWLIARSLDEDHADLSLDRISVYFDEPSEYQESATNLGPAVQWLRERGYLASDEDLRRGTKGYDIDRAVMLVRAALGAGYVSRRTALSMVMYAGEFARLRFGSWREFAASVLLGRAIWGGVNDPDGQFAERVMVIEMLLNDSSSPWLTAGWWPPREEGAANDYALPDEMSDDDPGPETDGERTLH